MTENYKPIKLVEYVRDGLIEQEHYGIFVKVSANGDVTKLGDDKSYPFFLRSCAKPLQASLIFDYGLDDFYNMSLKEIAVCSASHAGEDCHVNTIQGFLDKIGINKDLLKCGLHKPLSKTMQKKLIVKGEVENVLHNNCSGKHSMMLAICKKMGWPLEDYYKLAHPLQIAIKNKIYDLCEVKKEYPVTKDGCGVPIHSMPLENMVKGYLNLFFNQKYEKLKNAFIENPYLIGGEDRLDTAIISANPNLIAKVGACGLCIVINLESKEGLIIKVMDSDMKTRAICLIEALKQLGWLNNQMLENEYLKAQNKKDILTIHGEKIGEANFTFSFNK